jgi:cytochrome c peroxidase
MRRAFWLCTCAAWCLSAVPSAASLGPRLLGLDLYRPAPADNPLTPETIALGRQLFFDRRLSRDGSRSCASCHDPARAFGGRASVARGIGGAVGTRNVPAIVNRAWGTSFFWDGRAATLEDQVRQPILNPAELGMTPAGVEALARSDRYRSRFRTVFGAEPTLALVGRALASYVRSIMAGDAPYDRYLAGKADALRADALRGLGLFSGPARCMTCHSGPLLSDEAFHNTGVAWRTGVVTDEGRGGITGRPADRGAFKTPTLREVARTAPYMHDGSLHTLPEVIDFYDRGGHDNPGLDPQIRPLRLTAAEKGDLLAFLASLTGRVVEGR